MNLIPSQALIRRMKPRAMVSEREQSTMIDGGMRTCSSCIILVWGATKRLARTWCYVCGEERRLLSNKMELPKNSGWRNCSKTRLGLS